MGMGYDVVVRKGYSVDFFVEWENFFLVEFLIRK